MLNIEKEINKLINKYPDLWEEHLYRRGTILHRKNDILTTQIYHINSGIIKEFVYDTKVKKQIILNLFSDNDFLYFNKEAKFDIKVIEDVKVFTINNKNFDFLQKEEIILNEIVPQCHNKLIEQLLQQSIFLCYPPHLRYEAAIKIYPCLLRMRLYEVAEFLGVSERTVKKH